MLHIETQIVSERATDIPFCWQGPGWRKQDGFGTFALIHSVIKISGKQPDLMHVCPDVKYPLKSH